MQDIRDIESNALSVVFFFVVVVVVVVVVFFFITKTRLFKYIENFTSKN